jgi:carboxypeptidase Q
MALRLNSLQFSIFIVLFSSTISIPETSGQNCSLNPALIAEIQSYQPIANLIIETATNGAFKGMVYNETAKMVDKFGARLAGLPALEDSIDYMLEKMRTAGMANVRGENVTVPVWVRGNEKAEMLQPRLQPLTILGLIFSVGTPPEGITAEVLVVETFKELEENAELAKGRIVVYNQDSSTYAGSNPYRWIGASEAAKYGAVAALIRSATGYSLGTPHTGSQRYAENITQIPVAAITIEDAQLLHRIYKRGERIVVKLQMEAQNLGSGLSRNAIGELLGRQNPEQIVIVSGHQDSVDAGQGVADDGAATVFSAETLSLLKFLNLRPRRTVSAVLWTAEESILLGALAYVEKHRGNMHNIIAAFEADTGTFLPLGLDYAGPGEASCIMKEIVQLLTPINATTFRTLPVVGTDISYLTAEGVPSLGLNSDRFENEEYFNYHHSPADTMTAVDSGELDKCLAVWAVASYVVADLSIPLPRD